MAGTLKYFGSHVRHLTGSAEDGGRRSEDRIVAPRCDKYRYRNTPELGSRKRQRWAQLWPALHRESHPWSDDFSQVVAILEGPSHACIGITAQLHHETCNPQHQLRQDAPRCDAQWAHQGHSIDALGRIEAVVQGEPGTIGRTDDGNLAITDSYSLEHIAEPVAVVDPPPRSLCAAIEKALADVSDGVRSDEAMRDCQM